MISSILPEQKVTQGHGCVYTTRVKMYQQLALLLSPFKLFFFTPMPWISFRTPEKGVQNMKFSED